MQLQSGRERSLSRRDDRSRAASCWQKCAGGGLGGTSEVIEQTARENGQLHTVPVRETIPAGRLYMTGDLRALTGLPRTHMDFYLREGIIQPTTRTGSGYLLFDQTELEILRAVLRWRDEGVGIREIRDRLGRPASH
jgi:hypothetical protein